jgi:hypothetical protein
MYTQASSGRPWEMDGIAMAQREAIRRTSSGGLSQTSTISSGTLSVPTAGGVAALGFVVLRPERHVASHELVEALAP